LPIAFRALVPHTRSYARSGGRPRLRLIPATIPVKEALRQGRRWPATWVGTTGLSPSGSCFRSAVWMPPRGTDSSARRLCGSDGIAPLEGPAPCPRPWAARRAAHGGRLVATGLQGALRTLHDGAGRGCGLCRTEDEYRAARWEGRSAVGVPWPTERRVVSSSGLPWQLPRPAPPRSLQGAARRRSWRGERSADLEEDGVVFELWILLAIALLTAVAATYSLLTATGVFGGG